MRHYIGVSSFSTINIGNHILQLWKDVLLAQPLPANLSVPVVFAGTGSKEELDRANIKGKAVAILASPEGLNLNVPLWERRYPTYVLNKFRNDLITRGATAIIFITDDLGQQSWNQVIPAMTRGLQGAGFKLDTLWDKPTHIENWYFRSDHLPYARAGIPSIYFSTLLHPDYHTPMDEANRIDYAKLKKMSDWMYRTGWKVANADKRPRLELNFNLER